MRITSTFIRTIATGLATGATAVLITGCGPATTGQAPAAVSGNDQAAPYRGHPLENRLRTAFWSEQHIHDSWNRCHLGENAPPSPGC